MIAKIFYLLFLLGVSHAVDPIINSHYFPKGFKLGVAGASYQIEGGWNQDGKGENIWDWYTHTYPERIDDHSNGDIACDSYNKWKEDVQLLKELGVDHYRLSISWSRILTDGGVANKTVNREGVNYYKNLFKALVDAGITPLVTLYHWDLPVPIQDHQGWLNPLTAELFAEYARICFQEFGDLVKNWVTLNEPQTTCFAGYEMAFNPPAYGASGIGNYKCAYVHLLAHAKAYRIYEEEFKTKQKGRVSIVLNTNWAEPKSYSIEDTLAAERELDFYFGIYAHPIYKGNWPQTVIDIVNKRSELEGFSKSRLPKFTEEEIKLIYNSSDFFCLNTYGSGLISHANDATELITKQKGSFLLDKGTASSNDPSWPSNIGWITLYPSGLRKLLNYIYYTYGQPEIVVTENGWGDLTGTLKDQERITYIKQFLSAALDSYFFDGVNITGYTVWGFLDDYEWTNGYTYKLGLTQIDFNSPNRTRTPKDSFYWYKDVLAKRCLVEKCH